MKITRTHRSGTGHSSLVLAGMFLAMGTMGMATQGNAQNAGSMMVDVGPCIRLESAIQRFACYEQQVENTLTGSNQAFRPLVVPGSSTPAAPAPAPAASGTLPPTGQTAQMPPSAPMPAPATSTAPAPAPAVTSNDPEASFGLSEARTRQRDEVRELHSTITALEETVPYAYLITLANGQVWRQTTPDSSYRLQVGHNVRIYPSGWGSNYRLSAEPLRGFVQVERIR